MLHQFNNEILQRSQPMSSQVCEKMAQDRYSRNEKQDFKTAIDALYEFKAKLDELHPQVTNHINALLSSNRY